MGKAIRGHWFPFLQLGAVFVAWAIWYQDTSRGWVVGIAALPWLIRLIARQRRATPLDLPLLVFLATAFVGVWSAYDRDGSRWVFPAPIGWQKLWGILLTLLACEAVVAFEQDQLRWVYALLAGFGATVAFWFIISNDWTAQPAKWAFITRLGEALQRGLPTLVGHRLNNNVSGGIIVPLLPLGLGLAFAAWPQRAWLGLAWGLATALAMSAGLFLSSSRGGWIAVVGALGLGAAWWLAWRIAQKRRVAVFAALVTVAVVIGALAIWFSPLRAKIAGSGDASGRLHLYYQGLLLARDYPFTGSGLGNFALVHSTYALMIHVPILAHAHDLLLNIAIEQGVFGATAALAALAAAVWLGWRGLQRGGSPLLPFALMSLAALAAHGLVDDPLYSSRGLLFLWIPAGVVIAAVDDESRKARAWPWRAALVGAAVLLLVIFGRTLVAAWYADLGAVAQTQTELRLYDTRHFDNPTIYQVRERADLSAAEGYFARAVAFDSGQVTARTRASQIAFGKGDYEQALEQAQAAWDAGNRDRVTRLVLGDALASSGRPAEAAEVVQGLEWADGRFGGQAWYKYWIHGEYRLARDAWEAELILDPENARVAANLAEARKKVEAK